MAGGAASEQAASASAWKMAMPRWGAGVAPRTQQDEGGSEFRRRQEGQVTRTSLG